MTKEIPLTGYIEGYYGKLLSWNDRLRILDNLEKNKMHYYFYAPKEDVNHRLLWRKPYSETWVKNFKRFLSVAKSKNIEIIFGLAPGLDFDFNNLTSNLKSNLDLEILINKFKNLETIGVNNFSILFDDLQLNFETKYPSCPEEGKCHAIVANETMNKIKKPFFIVPRVYAKQLVNESPNYLIDFAQSINKEANIFFCGKYIVPEKINKNDERYLNKVFVNNIIFWDNFYSNDYCPRRLFLGPWIGRNCLKSILINGTGMIEIDLLIIDIVNNCNIKKNKYLAWKEVIIRNNIPKEFFDISIYFERPNFGFETKLNLLENKNLNLNNLEYLLWCWKTPLSRELYPFLMSLKHDLLLQRKKLSFDRIIKTQTFPLAELLLKKLGDKID